LVLQAFPAKTVKMVVEDQLVCLGRQELMVSVKEEIIPVVVYRVLVVLMVSV
tara:strand:- start:1497 stop:1652 length:156 start_codon:yes stop_codon:yes gene_type:complete